MPRSSGPTSRRSERRARPRQRTRSLATCSEVRSGPCICVGLGPVRLHAALQCCVWSGDHAPRRSHTALSVRSRTLRSAFSVKVLSPLRCRLYTRCRLSYALSSLYMRCRLSLCRSLSAGPWRGPRGVSLRRGSLSAFSAAAARAARAKGYGRGAGVGERARTTALVVRQSFGATPTGRGGAFVFGGPTDIKYTGASGGGDTRRGEEGGGGGNGAPTVAATGGATVPSGGRRRAGLSVRGDRETPGGRKEGGGAGGRREHGSA